MKLRLAFAWLGFLGHLSDPHALDAQPATAAPAGAGVADADPAVAASPDEPPVVEVVVTGSRTERPLAEAPVATEVISRTEIEASGAQHVADLLEEQGALYIERGVGGAGVQLQGLDPKYTLLLIDGQRTTGRVNGVNNLTRIPIEEVERIEIVRGAGSALYGSDAIGGVVNIITRQADVPLGLTAEAAYGSLGLLDATTQGSLRAGPVDSRVSLGFHRGDGYDLDPGDVATDGTAFDQANVGSTGRLWIGDDASLSWSGDYLFRDQRAVDESGGGAVLDRKSRTETAALRLAPQVRIGDDVTVKGAAGASLFRDQFLLDQRGDIALDQSQDTHELLLQGEAQLDAWITPDHLGTLGISVFRERLRTERLGTGDARRVRGAAFVQDEWLVLDASPRLSLVPGARVDLDSQFGVHPTPRLAVRLDPVEEVVIRASYGLGFRAPDFRELYLLFQNPSVGYVVEGNADLDPEHSRSAALSVEVRVSRAVWLSLSGFRNDLTDMIATDLVDNDGPDGAQRFSYVNVDRATTQGLDLAVRLSPIAGLHVDLGASALSARDRTRDRPLPGRPAYRGTLSVRYAHAKLGLSATARAALSGRQVFYVNGDGTDRREYVDPYATVDLRLEQNLGMHLHVFVLAENLLDAGDAEYLPLQPRTFMGGVGVRVPGRTAPASPAAN